MSGQAEGLSEEEIAERMDGANAGGGGAGVRQINVINILLANGAVFSRQRSSSSEQTLDQCVRTSSIRRPLRPTRCLASARGAASKRD